MSAIILKEPGMGIIARILNDVIAGVVAYAVSFIGCDLIYHDFSLSKSLKSAYWFFLGPFLWKWGKAIPFVFNILKNFVEGKWQSIKDKFIDWAEGFLPSWMMVAVPPVADIIDSAGPSMIESFQYIQENKTFY